MNQLVVVYFCQSAKQSTAMELIYPDDMNNIFSVFILLLEIPLFRAITAANNKILI